MKGCSFLVADIRLLNPQIGSSDPRVRNSSGAEFLLETFEEHWCLSVNKRNWSILLKSGKKYLKSTCESYFMK